MNTNDGNHVQRDDKKQQRRAMQKELEFLMLCECYRHDLLQLERQRLLIILKAKLN